MQTAAADIQTDTKETENAPHNRPSSDSELPGGTTRASQVRRGSEISVENSVIYLLELRVGRAGLLSSSEMSNGSELLIESPFAFREGQSIGIQYDDVAFHGFGIGFDLHTII